MSIARQDCVVSDGRDKQAANSKHKVFSKERWLMSNARQDCVVSDGRAR